MGLLEGIRVVEWAVLFNGDFVGELLGDLGADVIKVEMPGRGDYVRTTLGQITPGTSPSHLQVNRNKRSITLDVRTDEGLAVFWRLIETADVFVDGTAGDTLDRLGIGYEQQRKRKADIVYVQVSGFGAGPYAEVPTHGEMMNSLAAARPHVRDADGIARPKTELGAFGGTTHGARGSVAAGLFGTQYVLAALVHRDRTGEGAHIDVSGADAVVATAWQGAIYELNDHRITDRRGMPERLADGLRRAATYGFFETADGKFVMLAALEPKFWAGFCRAVGRDDLVHQVDPGEAMDFQAGDEELRAELRTIFRSRTLAEWMALAVEHAVPVGPAYASISEALDDEHMQSREIFVRGEHPEAGELVYVGRPAVVAGHPLEIRHHAPALGEQTDEVLAELGYAADDIARLRSLGVL